MPSYLRLAPNLSPIPSVREVRLLPLLFSVYHILQEAREGKKDGPGDLLQQSGLGFDVAGESHRYQPGCPLEED